MKLFYNADLFCSQLIEPKYSLSTSPIQRNTLPCILIDLPFPVMTMSGLPEVLIRVEGMVYGYSVALFSGRSA